MSSPLAHVVSPSEYGSEVVESGAMENGLPGELNPQCSAKGCRASAAWQLRWNNPKLHDAAYRKTWLACDDHKDHLSGFLDARRFLREVSPFPAASPRL